MYSITRTAFLIALHDAGLLQRWRDYVDRLDDVPTKIALEHDAMLITDSPPVQAVLRHFGWNDDKLRQLFAE